MSSKKGGSEGSDREGSETGSDERSLEYFGWVYHVGVNSIGHEYCHLRFLLLRGNKVEMFKRDPQEHPGIVNPHSFCSIVIVFDNLLKFVGWF